MFVIDNTVEYITQYITDISVVLREIIKENIAFLNTQNNLFLARFTNEKPLFVEGIPWTSNGRTAGQRLRPDHRRPRWNNSSSPFDTAQGTIGTRPDMVTVTHWRHYMHSHTNRSRIMALRKSQTWSTIPINNIGIVIEIIKLLDIVTSRTKHFSYKT